MTEQLIHALYENFNARDADRVLDFMVPEVQWPNGWEGGRIVGKDEVRAYWLRQWQEIDPIVKPLRIAVMGDEVQVRVLQSVYSLDGTLLSETEVGHHYTFHDGLIISMDISA